MATRTKKQRVTRDRLTAPAGLRAAFSMIALDGVNPSWATQATNATFPHAQRIVKTVLTRGDEGVVVQELTNAIRTTFPNLDRESEPAVTTAQEAAFNVGFAVCWLLLTAINGKETAR